MFFHLYANGTPDAFRINQPRWHDHPLFNLAKRPDRNARFLALNSHLPDLRRVDGVVVIGRPIADLIKEGSIAEFIPEYNAGTLGNALSHKLAWEMCIRNGTGGTIAEDDAVFNHHFQSRSQRIIASLPPDRDLIIWGWNFDPFLDVEILGGLRRCVMRFDSTMLGPKLPEFQKLDTESVPLRLFGAFGTIGYSCSLKGLQLLLQRCFSLRREMIPVPGLGTAGANSALDVLLNKHYPAIKAYACVPPLVWTENNKADSDVYPKAPESPAQ